MPRKTSATASVSRTAAAGFNEAAARCRGKRRVRVRFLVRPLGFNEAAARCRGKRGPGGEHALAVRGFNEAAARCRGKPKTARNGDVSHDPLQ